ncbi:MAG: cadherin-like domain-containing protein [Anaerolineales bacterium]
MESVLSGFVIVFLALFALFTLSGVVLVAHETATLNWVAMQDDALETFQTRLAAGQPHTTHAGNTVQWPLYNEGGVRLYDFAAWDVIVTTSADYAARWLPYDPAGGPGTWHVAAIQQRPGEAEIYDPGIFNPGETLVLQAHLPYGVSAASTLHIALATADGLRLQQILQANAMPSLVTQRPIVLAAGETITLTADILAATDDDDPIGDLTYTLLAAPLAGTLAPASFTQADLDAGAVTYTHTGSGDDSFSLTLSDGKDTVGPFTVDVQIDEAPTLTRNTGLAVPQGGQAIIQNIQLAASDVDTPPQDLVYTLTSPPTLGLLSLGDTFTQAQIDAGLLTYEQTSSGADSFAFTVTDGRSQIGPFEFFVSN